MPPIGQRKETPKESEVKRMRAADQWGIIMSITGLLYGLMNYVVWYRGLNDSYWGIDRSDITMRLVIIVQQFYLIAAVCWYLEVFYR